MLVGIPGAFLLIGWLATMIGAFLPDERAKASSCEKTHHAFLVTGLLHADIAIPVTPELKRQFAFLNSSTLPINHPNLRYLAFGWGSEAFYTTAGTYADIEAGAVLKAVTGDDSVMRVTAFGELKPSESIIRLALNEGQFRRLMVAIREGFAQPVPVQMAGVSIGSYDAFYEGQGHFDIFRPCNQWVNEVLVNSGVPVGMWTPTTQSLSYSLWFHAE